MNELKEALKELFKSGDIDIHVDKQWSEWYGESYEVTVLIDDEVVYKKEC